MSRYPGILVACVLVTASHLSLATTASYVVRLTGSGFYFDTSQTRSISRRQKI